MVATDTGLAAVLWEDDNPRRIRLGSTSENRKHPVLRETEKQLGEYFAGKRKRFPSNWMPRGQFSRTRCGRHCGPFRTVKREVTGRSPRKLEMPGPCAQSEPPMVKIRFQSSCPATASSALRAGLPVSRADWTLKNVSSHWKATRTPRN